jgi:hypothetical protein
MERRWRQPCVTRFRVPARSHATAIVALVTAHADRLNTIPLGKLVANFAQGQVKLELVEGLPAVRLDAKR